MIADKLNKITKRLPETLLIIGVLYYWVETSIVFNPIAIGLFLILSFLLITNNQIFGIISSLIFIFISVLMILAVISEYREFNVINNESAKLLTTGLLIFVTTFVLSVIMGLKHFAKMKYE